MLSGKKFKIIKNILYLRYHKTCPRFTCTQQVIFPFPLKLLPFQFQYQYHSWLPVKYLEQILLLNLECLATAHSRRKLQIHIRVNEERKSAKENSAVVNVLAIKRAYLTSLSIGTTKLKAIYNWSKYGKGWKHWQVVYWGHRSILVFKCFSIRHETQSDLHAVGKFQNQVLLNPICHLL